MMKRFRLIEELSPEYNRETQPAQWEADRVDYLSCVRQIIRRPAGWASGVGADLEEMEHGLRVLKALDGKKLGDLLELEDADWQHLADKARVFRWGLVDERLVRFTRTVLDAQEWPLDATDKERGHAPTGRVDGKPNRLRH